MVVEKIPFDSVRDKCSNCSTEFCHPEKEKSTKIIVRNDQKIEEEKQIIDVLERVFEISWNDFAVRYFIEEINTNLCNTDVYLKNIGLCQECQVILSQMYDAYLKFEILGQANSLIKTAKLFKCEISNKKDPEIPPDNFLDDHGRKAIAVEYEYHYNENSNVVEEYVIDPFHQTKDEIIRLTSPEQEEYEVKYTPDCDSSEELEEPKQLVVKLVKVSDDVLNQLSTSKRINAKRKIRTRSGRISRGRGRCEAKAQSSDYGSSDDVDTRKINFKKGSKKRKVKAIRKYECQDCEKVFNVKKLLLLHKKVHKKESSDTPGPGPHQCNVCGKFYRSYKHLNSSHMQMHEGKIEPMPCDVCGKVLKSKYCLNVHLARKHPSEEEKAKSKTECKICGKVISIHNKTHIALHSRDEGRKFKCDICDRLFRYKCLLSEHMHRHDEANALKNICELCGRSFPLERELKAHVKRHSVQRNFECELCGNKFKRIYELNRHKITHTDERPFVCDECGKTFKLATHLAIHLKCHRDEELSKEKFKCTECDKYFKHSLGLYKHQVKYHRPDLKKKIYECPYCSKRFAGATGLKLHVSAHEKQLMNGIIL